MQDHSNNTIFLSQASHGDFNMRTVLLRIDMNVPLGANGVVDSEEAYRIESALPTIEWLRDAGAQILLIGHMGKGKDRDAESLEPLLDYFQGILGSRPAWLGDLANTPSELLPQMYNLGKNIILCETLRFWPGSKPNNPDFVKSLVQSADMYVNDAFSVSHRDHASMTGIPQHLSSFLGLHIEKELHTLDAFIKKDEPTLMVIGGAKFGTKLALIQKFLDMGYWIAVVGALAHAIYQARDIPTGKSLVDDEVDVSTIATHERLLVADTVIVGDENKETKTVPVGEVKEGHAIFDAAPVFVDVLDDIIEKNDITRVLWNGPFGWYEEGFIDGSVAFAQLLKKYKGRVQSVVGGGDTVTLLRQEELIGIPDFVSTGGGALLDYLNDGELVAIEAVKMSKNDS